MTTAIDRSDPQGEGPSPRSLGQEISNAQDPQVVRIEEDDKDVGGDADAGDVVNFPKSLLKRIVKEQLMNSGEAAIRDNGSIDCSRVQVSGVLSVRWLSVVPTISGLVACIRQLGVNSPGRGRGDDVGHTVGSEALSFGS